MRISDWSSDVCSSDLPSEAHWQRLIRAGTSRRYGGHPPERHLGRAATTCSSTLCNAIRVFRSATYEVQRGQCPRPCPPHTLGRRSEKLRQPARDRKSTRLNTSN